MQRSMLQVYVRESDKAAALYQKAFDARMVISYPYPNGTFMHAELDVYGQILAISEAAKDEETVTGNPMQFCLHFGKGKEVPVQTAYEALKESAVIICPPGPCPFCPLMFDLVDRYGVRWCVFVINRF